MSTLYEQTAPAAAIASAATATAAAPASPFPTAPRVRGASPINTYMRVYVARIARTKAGISQGSCPAWRYSYRWYVPERRHDI